MNETQHRLWGRMIELIHEFGEGKILYHRMVDQLEAVLDDGDFKNSELVQEWYLYWTPLEELDEESSHDLDIDREAIRPLLEKMNTFLLEQKKTWGHPRPNHPHHHPHPTHHLPAPKSAAAEH